MIRRQASSNISGKLHIGRVERTRTAFSTFTIRKIGTSFESQFLRFANRCDYGTMLGGCESYQKYVLEAKENQHDDSDSKDDSQIRV
jgi:hypothetical protein